MFHFRLQRVLELREQYEQAKARALTDAQDAADDARRAHDALTALHASSRAEVDAAQSAQPRVGHLHQLGYVLQSLEQRVELAADSVVAADTLVSGAQRELDDAARDRRVLDRLKARHAEAWRTDVAQQDRLQMDEIALGRFARRAEARDDAHASSDSSENSKGGFSTRNDGPNR